MKQMKRKRQNKKRTPVYSVALVSLSVVSIFLVCLAQGEILAVQGKELEVHSQESLTRKSTLESGALFEEATSSQVASSSSAEKESTSSTEEIEELTTTHEHTADTSAEEAHPIITETTETAETAAVPPVLIPEPVETTPSTEEVLTVSYSRTTDEFIQLIGPKAQLVANRYDLYASVMIAQGILESASGNSALAREPNYNLFGIKGTYEGQGTGFPTQEDDGSGHLYTITATFRKYPSYTESLEDYAKLLQNDFYVGARKSQASTYQEATQFLTGRYATDTSYHQKLNALIKTYDLTRFDGEAVEEVLMSTTSDVSNGRVEVPEQPAIEQEKYGISMQVMKGKSVKIRKEITAKTPVNSVFATESPYVIGGG